MPLQLKCIFVLNKSFKSTEQMGNQIIVSTDYKDLYLILFRIFDCVPCAAWFSVEDGYYPTALVNYPFVPPLKAVSAVAGAYEPCQIGLLQNGIVPRLPIRRPSAFKPTIG